MDYINNTHNRGQIMTPKHIKEIKRLYARYGLTYRQLGHALELSKRLGEDGYRTNQGGEPTKQIINYWHKSGLSKSIRQFLEEKNESI